MASLVQLYPVNMENYWKNKMVLVTGAGGFIGSHMVGALVGSGAKVTALFSGSTTAAETPDVSSVSGDLLSMETCVHALKGQDVVCNMAALDGGTSFKRSHSAEIFTVNTTITSNVLEAARIHKTDKLLLMSSAMVYPGSLQGIIDEGKAAASEAPDEYDGYARSKKDLEASAQQYSKQYGMHIALARPGNTYGPGDTIQKGRIIPSLIHKALLNETITITGNGENEVSFLHVDDLVNNLLALTELYAVADPVNLASERYIRIRELVDMIISLAGSKSNVVYTGDMTEVPPKRILSVAKAKKVIHFSETVTLENGVRSLIEQMTRTK